jgi:hypothetical protein
MTIPAKLIECPRNATVSGWQNCLDKWLNPNLGDLPLQQVSNATVKVLVGKVNEARLSPKTISNYVGVVKLVVASGIGDDGEDLT